MSLILIRKSKKFVLNKCRELYFSIKDAMEKAVTRLNNSLDKTDTPSSSDLGGEFAISNLETEEEGFLQISMEGIEINFESKKVCLFSESLGFEAFDSRILFYFFQSFIELKRVRKCTTQKDDIFVLEEFGKLTYWLL